MKLGEFFIDLFVDASEGELSVSNLVHKMGELEAATVGQLGALFALGSKLAAFTDISIKMALGLEQFTTLTGESSQGLQQWQRVAEHVNVSGEDVSKTFLNLSSSLAALNSRGEIGRLKPLVDVLGLDPRGKNAQQILEFVKHSEIFAKMSNRAKTDLLEAAGIAPMLANVFKLSDDKFREHGSLVPGMSAEQEEELLHASTILSDIGSVAKQLVIDIGALDAKYFINSLDIILDKLKEVRKWYSTTTDEQVKEFNMVVHPLSKESKETWGDILKYATSVERINEERESFRPKKGFGIAGYPDSYLGGSFTPTVGSIVPERNNTTTVTQHFVVGATPNQVHEAAKRGTKEALDHHISTAGSQVDVESR